MHPDSFAGVQGYGTPELGRSRAIATKALHPVDHPAKNAGLRTARLPKDQFPVFDEDPQGPPETELPRELDGVTRGSVLDDPTVLETADDNAVQLDRAAPMGAAKRPPRSNLVTLAHLIVDLEAEVGEQRQVEGNRASGPIVAGIGEPVYMVDEVGVVDAGDPVEVSAGTNLL